MQTRSDGWTFGPANPFSEDQRQWYARHLPTVDRWLTELEDAGDPWWVSAEHAASCLVSNREMNVAEPTWDGFDVGEFLFLDLWEGGTVGSFGSVPIFFDHLVEALRRFTADGIVEAEAGRAWIAQMLDAREDFIRCYDEATPSAESRAIARRHRPPSTLQPAAPDATPRRQPKKLRRTRHPRRRSRRRARKAS